MPSSQPENQLDNDLDNILANLAWNGKYFDSGQEVVNAGEVIKAKLALTNAVKELVKETMPEPTSAFDGSEAQVFIIATDQYQANLLKAIGDE